MEDGLYVDYMLFYKLIKETLPPHVINDIANGSIATMDCDKIFKLVVERRMIKSAKDAERDKYLVPIYLYGILTDSIGSSLFFIDELFKSGKDKISFLGGHMKEDDTPSLEFSFNEMVHNQMTRAGSYGMFITDDIIFELSRYFKVLNTVERKFYLCQCIHPNSSNNKGIYFYVPIVVQYNDSFAPITKVTCNYLMNLDRRDKLIDRIISGELKSTVADDDRVNKFDIVSTIMSHMNSIHF